MKIVIVALLIVLLILLAFTLLGKKEEQEPEVEEKIPKLQPPADETEEVFKKSMPEVELVTIYDNYQVNPHLKTGWGFSCFVRRSPEVEGGFNILFDTGADSPTLLSNMEKLKILPEEIDIVILSHIHGDHVGGLTGFLEANPNVGVYVPASFPVSFKNEIAGYGVEVVEIKEQTEISKNVFSTGEMGTIKEQSLVLNTDKGLVVITGCAHPGVVNIVKKAKEIFEKDIYLVLGGFHLFGAIDSELRDILKDFRGLAVEKVAPCHCSGDRCRELFKEEYGQDYIENGVGKIIEI